MDELLPGVEEAHHPQETTTLPEDHRQEEIIHPVADEEIIHPVAEEETEDLVGKGEVEEEAVNGFQTCLGKNSL
jgi:hypothetical protein